MSRPTGISRKRRKGRPVATDTDAAKAVDNKPLRNIFDDFDLSDIKLNSDTLANNSSSEPSFRSAKTCSTSVANESSIIDQNESNIDSFSTKSLINNFNGFHFDSDLSLLSTKAHPTASTSFATFSKPSLIQCDSTSKSSTNNKRKNISGIFEGFDLSDIKTDDSFTSFQSSRKAVKTRDPNVEEDIDFNDNKSSVSFKTPKSFTKTKDLKSFGLSDTKRNTPFNCPLTTKGFNKCDIFGDLDLSDINGQSFASNSNSKNGFKPNNSNIFGDLDLSDIKEKGSFASFQSSRKILANDEPKPSTVSRNPEEEEDFRDNKDLNFNDVKLMTSPECDTNSPIITTELNSDLKTNPNINIVHKVNKCFDGIDLTDLQFMSQSVTRFEYANKVFKISSKSSPSKRTDDSALAVSDISDYPSLSIKENERKNIISNIFEDLDLSDVNFSDSVISFRNSRTAYQPPATDSPPETARQTDIDWNEMQNIFDESFEESQNFMTSSPKPIKCLKKIKSESQKFENNCKDSLELSLIWEDQSFAECAARVVENMNLIEGTKLENRTDIDNECDSKLSNNDCGVEEEKKENSSFNLRTDFDTLNDISCDELINIFDDTHTKKCKDQVIDNNFKGFRSGTGRTFIFTEEQLTEAKQVFKDIEEWLLDEITSNRLEINDSDEDFYSYSQKFIINDKNIGHKVNEQLVPTESEMSSSTVHNS